MSERDTDAESEADDLGGQPTGTRTDEDEPVTTVRISDRDTTVIARTITRVVTPLILLTAVVLLIRGHNLPGGGFIAGVLTAAAVALVYVIYGLEHVDRELLRRTQGNPNPDPNPAPAGTDAAAEGDDAGIESLVPRSVRGYATLFAVGLAVSAGSGLAAMALGAPFLTQAVVFLEGLPIYHEIELASALVFDLGVYFVVVGSVLTIITVVGAE